MVLDESASAQMVSQCLKLLEKFEWLLDCYVLDFFVDEHWSKIPLSWQQTLRVKKDIFSKAHNFTLSIFDKSKLATGSVLLAVSENKVGTKVEQSFNLCSNFKLCSGSTLGWSTMGRSPL